MNALMRQQLARFNPAVPRHYLFMISGLLWTIAGGMLCARALVWLAAYRVPAALEIMGICLLLATTAYTLLFSPLVRTAISRIHRLPDRVCLFAFTAWRGYFMIGLMVTAGITLRDSPIPRYLLVVPYSTMGSVLLAGSLMFYRQFLKAAP